MDKSRTESERATALAVALKADQPGDEVPRIVATGSGAMAEQILQIAFDRGVKVREDADLVQLLAAVEVDSLIPVEAFAAVAEIMSYVYRANRETPVSPQA